VTAGLELRHVKVYVTVFGRVCAAGFDDFFDEGDDFGYDVGDTDYAGGLEDVEMGHVGVVVLFPERRELLENGQLREFFTLLWQNIKIGGHSKGLAPPCLRSEGRRL